DINWLLERDYQVRAKDYSGVRAQKLAESVSEWIDDPRIEGRQVGWVSEQGGGYVRPVRRIAVRCRKKNGQWGVGVIISSLEGADVLALTEQDAAVQDADAVMLADVYFYDQRGGGVETAFKDDKQ